MIRRRVLADPRGGTRSGVKSWLINTACGLLAYTGSRFLWSHRELELGKLPLELLTFAALYLLLQVLIRGRSLARQGKGE